MESENIKYTTDGKKVVVLGNLNSQEKIVQEIFVVDNSEIPSGEHFVVRSLHDFPAMSWKEKKLKDVEEEFNNKYNQKEDELGRMIKDFDFKIKTVKEKFLFLKQLDKNVEENKFDQLISFIVGDIKYVVIDQYGDLYLEEYDSAISRKEYGRFDSLRLLSVFGNTEGDLCYRMNQYRDGSGSWSDIHPFSTKEEALSFLKEQFDEKIKIRLTDKLVKLSKEYGFEIPNDIMEKYKSEQRKGIQRHIDDNEKRLADLRNQLSSI